MTDFAAEFKELKARYDEADTKLDATLEAVTVSKWTPVILIGSIIAAFAMGVWVG